MFHIACIDRRFWGEKAVAGLADEGEGEGEGTDTRISCTVKLSGSEE